MNTARNEPYLSWAEDYIFKLLLPKCSSMCWVEGEVEGRRAQSLAPERPQFEPLPLLDLGRSCDFHQTVPVFIK